MPGSPDALFSMYVTAVEVYSPPTCIVSPLAASAGSGRPRALATSAAAPPRDAARIALRERGVAVSTVISGLPLSFGQLKTCQATLTLAVVWAVRKIVNVSFVVLTTTR